MSYDNMARLTLDEVKRKVEEMKLELASQNNNLDHIVFADENDDEIQEEAVLSDEEIRIAEVRNIKNQDMLMDIVYGDEGYEIKYEALLNLCDENLDKISENIDDDFIIELIDDIKFERAFKRRHVSGLS